MIPIYGKHLLVHCDSRVSRRPYVADLVAALLSVCEEWADGGGPLALGEAVFVDDGSDDGFTQLLAQLQLKHIPGCAS